MKARRGPDQARRAALAPEECLGARAGGSPAGQEWRTRPDVSAQHKGSGAKPHARWVTDETWWRTATAKGAFFMHLKILLSFFSSRLLRCQMSLKSRTLSTHTHTLTLTYSIDKERSQRRRVGRAEKCCL